MQYIPDRAIKNPDEDLLGHSMHAEKLVATLLGAMQVAGDEGLSVAVLGNWGSGKSGFLNLMKHFFNESKKATSYEFDAWKHE